MQKEKVSLFFTIVPFNVLQVIWTLFCLLLSFEYILVEKLEIVFSTGSVNTPCLVSDWEAVFSEDDSLEMIFELSFLLDWLFDWELSVFVWPASLTLLLPTSRTFFCYISIVVLTKKIKRVYKIK